VTETFDELAAFDSAFTPSPGRRPGIDSLPDGDHDFEVLSAEMGRTETSNELILRVGLKTAGRVVEYAYFFRTQQSVDILGSDLCTLGFDADQWKAPHRPFSKELPLAVPRMPGIRFRGKKVTRENKKDPAKPFHNLYVNQRLDGAAPGAPPAAYTPGPAADPFADDIPF
jgi:hypothetical protein